MIGSSRFFATGCTARSKKTLRTTGGDEASLAEARHHSCVQGASNGRCISYWSAGTLGRQVVSHLLANKH